MTTPDEHPNKTLTVKDIAAITDRSISTVQKWMRKGYIPAVRIGNEYRVSKADLNEWWKGRGGNVLFPEATPEWLREVAADAEPDAEPEPDITPRIRELAAALVADGCLKLGGDGSWKYWLTEELGHAPSPPEFAGFRHAFSEAVKAAGGDDGE
jgi:excisionase family DNA binding protein